MTTVSNYLKMNKQEIVRYSELLVDSLKQKGYKIEYPEVEAFKNFILEDIVCELLLMESDLYEHYNDEKVQIQSIVRETYTNKEWKDEE